MIFYAILYWTVLVGGKGVSLGFEIWFFHSLRFEIGISYSLSFEITKFYSLRFWDLETLNDNNFLSFEIMRLDTPFLCSIHTFSKWMHFRINNVHNFYSYFGLYFACRMYPTKLKHASYCGINLWYCNTEVRDTNSFFTTCIKLLLCCHEKNVFLWPAADINSQTGTHHVHKQAQDQEAAE